MKYLSGAIILCAAAALHIAGGASNEAMAATFTIVGVLVMIFGNEK